MNKAIVGCHKASHNIVHSIWITTTIRGQKLTIYNKRYNILTMEYHPLKYRNIVTESLLRNGNMQLILRKIHVLRLRGRFRLCYTCCDIKLVEEYYHYISYNCSWCDRYTKCYTSNVTVPYYINNIPMPKLRISLR